MLCGCFAAQRNQININADNRLRELDAQCKDNMTDWCIVQYDMVQRNREQELQDISRRQRETAESIREAGKPFGELGRR
jgi:hypothetical protein